MRIASFVACVGSLLGVSLFCDAQNLIVNPSFEQGSIPTAEDQVSFATGWSKDCGTTRTCSPGNPVIPGTPDLFDARSVSCRIDVPINKWATNRTERTSQNRYVGFSGNKIGGCPNDNGIPYYGETVKGTLTSSLNLSSCQYRVSLYGALTQARSTGSNPCLNLQAVASDPNYNKIQVVLRKDNDCVNGLVVFTSPNVASTSWTQYTTTFQLTPAQASVGYNRIEFRLTPTPWSYSFVGQHIVFMDDVSLTVEQSSSLSSDFTLVATNPTNSTTNYIVTASVASIAPGSSYYWEVCEVTLLGNNIISGTCMTNPSNWWHSSLELVNTFPGYCCNSTPITGGGNFLLGHKYKVTRGVWSQCAPWASTDKYVYMSNMQGSGGNRMFGSDENFDVFESQLASSDLVVSPNPASDNISLSVHGIDGSIDFVEVLSTSGAIVFRGSYNASRIVLDGSGWQRGLYIVRATVKDRVLQTRLVLE